VPPSEVRLPLASWLKLAAPWTAIWLRPLIVEVAAAGRLPVKTKASAAGLSAAPVQVVVSFT
jgi:hypothetical protein